MPAAAIQSSRLAVVRQEVVKKSSAKSKRTETAKVTETKQLKAMDGPTRTYRITCRPSEIVRALGSLFVIQKESRQCQTKTYFDTFDWRLHRRGMRLFAQPTEGGWQLTCQSSAGVLQQELKDLEQISFEWCLPQGEVRRSLAAITEMRRLLPKIRIDCSQDELRLLDQKGTTCLRVYLEELSASDPSSPRTKASSLLPRMKVEGRPAQPKAFQNVVELVESQLALPSLDEDEFLTTLAGLGQRPQEYSRKIRIKLQGNWRSDWAMKQIHLSLLQIIRLNEEGLLKDVDSEFLHDFRVAVRRTRSALTQVEDVFCPESLNRFRSEFSWLGALTGPVRDLDVYLLKIPRYQKLLPGTIRADLDPLVEFLKFRKLVEHTRLAQEIQSPRYRNLIRSWHDFLQADPTGVSEPGNAATPISTVATSRIRRAACRVLKRGAKIGTNTEADKLHRLRIDCKKLRYLLEFFRTLYPNRSMRLLIDRLKTLQDCLGDFNDARIQQEMLKRFASEMEATGNAPVEIFLAMGWVIGHLEEEERRHRSDFADHFARFSSRKNRKRLRKLFRLT